MKPTLRPPALPPVLVTGFEPFAGDARNPSQEVAQALEGAEVAGHVVRGVVLPCIFGRSRRELERALRVHRPGLVIGLGLAGGRAAITPERVAINVDDARIPDNAGQSPIDRPVVRGGPAAYWSTLPVKAIVAALQDIQIPAAVSQTAGTFVCNHVFYGLMHALRTTPATRGGFIHLPYILEQGVAGQPALSLEQEVEAVRRAIEVCLARKRDVRAAGGQTA